MAGVHRSFLISLRRAEEVRWRPARRQEEVKENPIARVSLSVGGICDCAGRTVTSPFGFVGSACCR